MACRSETEFACAGAPEPLGAFVMTIRLLFRWLAWLLVLAVAVFTLARSTFGQ